MPEEAFQFDWGEDSAIIAGEWGEQRCIEQWGKIKHGVTPGRIAHA